MVPVPQAEFVAAAYCRRRTDMAPDRFKNFWKD